MLPMREPSRDSIDVSQAPGQHRRPDPTQANMLNFTTTTTAAAASAEANCKWKSKQPAVFGFWFLVLWLRFHNMTAATASALALQLQHCNTATNVLLIFGYQYRKAKQARALQKVIKCVTACCWSCKFLHAGQKGRQLLPAVAVAVAIAAAADCCNCLQCCTRPSTASDMQLSTSIELSTVTTERQRPRPPLNAAKITQSRPANSRRGNR